MQEFNLNFIEMPITRTVMKPDRMKNVTQFRTLEINVPNLKGENQSNSK